jgi:hypothetical protein
MTLPADSMHHKLYEKTTRNMKKKSIFMRMRLPIKIMLSLRVCEVKKKTQKKNRRDKNNEIFETKESSFQN